MEGEEHDGRGRASNACITLQHTFRCYDVLRLRRAASLMQHIALILLGTFHLLCTFLCTASRSIFTAGGGFAVAAVHHDVTRISAAGGSIHYGV